MLAGAGASAAARDAFVGQELHERAAARLARWTGALGLEPQPTQSATLAVTLFLQLVVGVGGGCAGHALVSASLRRKFRDRVAGPPATAVDAELRATEQFDAALLATAALAGVGAVAWWGLSEVLPMM